MSKKENLSGSYSDDEIHIIGNDPKHAKRKQKIRNLDDKPIEGMVHSWSRRKRAFWIFLFVGFTALAIWGFNSITNLSPPL